MQLQQFHLKALLTRICGVGIEGGKKEGNENVLFHVLTAFVTLNWMIKFVQHSLFQGVVELAAVGVSISTFNLVSRMFNMPLLNVTTSFVADDASKENRVNLSSDPASPTLPGILWLK